MFLIVAPNPESLMKEVAGSVNLIIWSKRGTDQFPTHCSKKIQISISIYKTLEIIDSYSLKVLLNSHLRDQ